jgi:hypothetical protein
MRLLTSLTANAVAVCIAILLACASNNAVEASKAVDRWPQLAQLVDSKTNVLTFTSVNTYTKFVQNSGRNYDAFVLLVSFLWRRPDHD